MHFSIFYKKINNQNNKPEIHSLHEQKVDYNKTGENFGDEISETYCPLDVSFPECLI